MNWFYIVFTGVMFGSLGLCTKYLTGEGISPFLCAAIPFAITGILAVLVSRRILPDTPWALGMALGSINAAAPALLFNIGFNELPASVVTIVLALGPVFTAVTAHFAMHDDRFTLAKGAGLVVSFAGVGILAGAPSGSVSSLPALLITLAGAAVSGSSLVWVKRITLTHPPRMVLPAMMAGAGVTALVVASLTGNPPWSLRAGAGEIALLVAMGVGGLLTFYSSLKANELNPASRAGLMGYLVPLVGVLGGVLLFSEPLTVSLLFGGAAIIAGVALVGGANRAEVAIPSG